LIGHDDGLKNKYLDEEEMDAEEEEEDRRNLAFRRKSANAHAGGMGVADNPLDSFFPFDPYLLRVSSR
jgi:hypothetical protein